jgi:hypothetical protein
MNPLQRIARLSPRVRYALAWLVLAGGLTFGLLRSWHYFDDPKRRDGNSGHATIDFAGQWLMGRMLLEGHARHLYDRAAQRGVLRPVFPAADESPTQTESDVEDLMASLMGKDDPDATRNVGGPLYPPLNAFLQAPLALLPPRVAYRTMHFVNLGLLFACGLAVVRLSRGAFWLPVATLLVACFPGFGGCLNLGQNSALSLAILMWGWVLLDEGREGWAGVVWGLLAFKPVWAAAFFLVPLVTRRWRMAGAMLATGAALGVATLPVVGVGAWLDWLHVGREAAAVYEVNENWINQSRDLLGAARRWMLDFDAPDEARRASGLVPTVIGWGLLLAVLGATAAVALRRPRQARATRGPAAAFVLLGAWLGCYHFIYYDVLLAALPVSLLFLERASWRPSVPLLLTALTIVLPNVQYVVHEVFGLRIQFPWDQYLLFALWLWCGRQWLADERGNIFSHEPRTRPDGPASG